MYFRGPRLYAEAKRAFEIRIVIEFSVFRKRNTKERRILMNQ